MPPRRPGAPLANPEDAWLHPEVTQDVAEAEARRCLGRVDAPVTALGGGLANMVLRIGDDRVLRIYRRDVAQLPLEASLLQRPWQRFRVPRLLKRGDDYLLLEHVPHGPLTDDAVSGAHTGAALAEIHATRMPQHGHIDETLRVIEPWPDFMDALLAYAREVVPPLDDDPPGDRRPLHATLRDALEALTARRPQLEVAIGDPVLLHGDFKVSNLHLATDGALLVLDWEFAFASPALCDIGQLMRWDPSPAFADAFAHAYRSGGGALPPAWRRAAATIDLTNLMVLMTRAPTDARRVGDLAQRICATVTED